MVTVTVRCHQLSHLPEGDGCLVEQNIHAVAVEQQHTLSSAICMYSNTQQYITCSSSDAALCTLAFQQAGNLQCC
jgi:hypothetical protein